MTSKPIPETDLLMNEIISDSWPRILQISVTSALIYVALVLMLRLSGKRTLTQMNAFDFIVSVALGSVVATTILSEGTAFTGGLTGLGLLILLQFVIAWLYVRLPWFSRLVKSEPRLLFYQGNFKSDAMKAERIEEAEMLQAARAQGILHIQQIEAIVLETNGTLSIVKTSEKSGSTTLQNVAGWQPENKTGT